MRVQAVMRMVIAICFVLVCWHYRTGPSIGLAPSTLRILAGSSHYWAQHLFVDLNVEAGPCHNAGCMQSRVTRVRVQLP